MALFFRSVHLLAYANDIDITGRTKQDVTAAINEDKSNYMLSTSREVRRTDFQITAVNYTFDTIKEFIYLDSAVTGATMVSMGK